MLNAPRSRRDFVGRMGGLGALLAVPAPLRAVATRLAQERLPTRPVPATGERLPIVGFGSTKAVLEIPTEGPEPVAAVIRQLMGLGGRVVDTSIRPPEIDAVFGRVLQEPDIRDGIFLATKINTEDAATGVEQMRQTQRLFGRTRVDLVQVESLRGIEHHWPRLREWKDSGETRYVGVTVAENFNHDDIEGFMRRESPDFVHVNYSLLEPGVEERILPLARDRGMAVLVNRPFMNGTYFGRVEGRALPEWVAGFGCETWAQFSLKYILANPAVTCVLTETTNPEHMDENVRAGFGRLPDEDERRRMREVAATL
jgi:diketogulonate reductase-like aldo/keto reductase